MPIKRIERPVTAQQFEQEKQEDMQQIVLIALAKAGIFDVAAFYGGTCLRLIHGLDRFSEDLDFSLLQKDENFNLEKYFPAIINEFKMKRKHFPRHSAFLPRQWRNIFQILSPKG